MKDNIYVPFICYSRITSPGSITVQKCVENPIVGDEPIKQTSSRPRVFHFLSHLKRLDYYTELISSINNSQKGDIYFQFLYSLELNDVLDRELPFNSEFSVLRKSQL